VTNAEAFVWGFCGSLALEIVTFCQVLRKSRTGKLPAIYRSRAFLIGRLLLAVVAGIVSAALGLTQPIQGFVTGAATPQLVLSMEQLSYPSLRGDGEGK
jgi:hypothetical protein